MLMESVLQIEISNHIWDRCLMNSIYWKWHNCIEMKKSPRIWFLLVFPAVLEDTGHTVQTCDWEGLMHKKKQSMLLTFFPLFLFYNILAGKMSVLINPQLDTGLQAGRGVH